MTESENKAILREKLEEVMDRCLTDREKQILKMRSGLDDGTPKTLDEVAAYFNVTRERIRQIEAKAMKTLKRKMKNIDDYEF